MSLDLAHCCFRTHEECVREPREFCAGSMFKLNVTPSAPATPYRLEEFRCGDSDTTGQPYFVGPAQCEVDASRTFATISENARLRAALLEVARDGSTDSDPCWCADWVNVEKGGANYPPGHSASCLVARKAMGVER